jgi:hypothetical protein
MHYASKWEQQERERERKFNLGHLKNIIKCVNTNGGRRYKFLFTTRAVLESQ